MSRFVLTELRRTGQGVLSPTPVRFEWDSDTHTAPVGDPETPFTVKTSRRTPVGAEEPIEQVLSTEWEPFTVEGEWSDRWAGRGFTKQTYLDFARMVGRTPDVRMEIDDTWVFRGLITRLVPRYRRKDVHFWEITFSPHANEVVGPARPTELVTKVAKPVSQRTGELDDAATALEAALEAARSLPMRTEDLAQAEVDVAAVRDGADRALAVTAAGLAEDATQTLLQMASHCRRVRTAALDAMENLADRSGAVVSALDDVVETLRVDEWLRTTRVQALQTAGLASIAEGEMRARAARRPRAVHRCRPGDSLERISLLYYGTPDAWRLIYDANHLSSIVLVVGQELVIPERGA